MPRFAANLSTMYQDLPFLDRFAVARADGFQAVEFMFPYEYPAGAILERLQDNDLVAVLFNAYAGEYPNGYYGFAAVPGLEQEFDESVEQAISYAKELRTQRVHLMAGLIEAGTDIATARATYVENLKRASARFAKHNLVALIEPLNTHDVPGYYLNRQEEAYAVIKEVGASNLMVQMDFYHAQIMEGNLAARFERHRGQVGHIQVAGVPGRNEPDTGEINYPFLFSFLDRQGYAGWIGCEYTPKSIGHGGTSAGLQWLKPYLN